VGNIDVLGNLLGRQGDDVVVGLYKDARTKNVITEFTSVLSAPADPPQHKTILHIRITDKVLPGVYRLIYTVNGQQAKHSPQVTLDLP
jgi:hypothetical protein